ncbi:MAG TPA: hypothetical protein VJ552_02750 [Sediminibacterium sp.]|nr:hypothetical protein [Sediminibacterium sp.]
MRINSTIPKRTKEEQEAYERLRQEKMARRVAIVIAFISVYYFFIKLLFL